MRNVHLFVASGVCFVVCEPEVFIKLVFGSRSGQKNKSDKGKR